MNFNCFSELCRQKRLLYPEATKRRNEFRQAGPKDLTIGVFLPTVTGKSNGSVEDFNGNLMPAIGQAVDDIQSKDCLLDGYKLTVQTKDTKVKGFSPSHNLIH